MAWPETVRKTDFEITWFSGTGGGGQHRNKHANCCRMKHKPTGTVTTGQSNKSRPANQKEAFTAQTKILVPLMRASVKQDPEATSEEVVRTYHFPRKTVKDHRTGKSHDLKKDVGRRTRLGVR